MSDNRRAIVEAYDIGVKDGKFLERERCAKIAEDFPNPMSLWENAQKHAAAEYMQKEIAAAIRKQTTE